MVHATPRTLTNRFIPAYPRWDGTKKEVPRYISERIGPLLLNTLCERKERETERTWREKKRDERERRRLPRLPSTMLRSHSRGPVTFTRLPFSRVATWSCSLRTILWRKERRRIDGSIDFCQRPSFFNRSHPVRVVRDPLIVVLAITSACRRLGPHFVLSLTSSSSFF